MEKNKKRQFFIQAGLAAAGIAAAFVLLKGDALSFLTWWMLLLFLSVGFLPLTATLFQGFADRGWIFSKLLGTAVCGYLTWVLVCGKILPFTFASCAGVTLLCILGNLWWNFRRQKNGAGLLPTEELPWIFWQELLFFLLFLLWTYFSGFRPQAYGTEKFMDYGFMEAMMRSTTLPAVDPWYSEGTINYYYGGQYFAVFLTKLSFTRVEETYHLMRTLVAAAAFSAPCALTVQLLRDRFGEKKRRAAVFGGILGGAAVSLAGNMHYIVYGKVQPLLQKLGISDKEPEKYWFPNATRYIGHHPQNNDRTIHEFPSYSFILGDLHAHVVNLLFVVLVLGLLYAWMKRVLKEEPQTGRIRRKNELLAPELLCVGWLLGMFQWTNFWDFVIYYVVTGGIVVFANVPHFHGKFRTAAAVTAGQAAVITALSYAAALPFHASFETMVQGVALCQNHSPLYQLAVLWGLPVLLALAFFGSLLYRRKTDGLCIPDRYLLVLALCALGLVLLPELVYVRDIYEETSARANTMFKLTYQAFLLFGIVMAGTVSRYLFLTGTRRSRAFGLFSLLALLSTFGYVCNAVPAWFGKVWNVSGYQGLDATAYIEKEFPEDAKMIRWLKENISGSPVVLEANGDSYSDYNRISAMTGLPTVAGWYVHEWLWRGDTMDLNEKNRDIETIYTSKEEETVRELLEKYRIEYIAVGRKEREKYENLQAESLTRFGEVVFRAENSETFLIKVQG